MLDKPVVEIKAQGRLLKVRSVGLDLDMPRRKVGSKVDGFSKASRLRLLQLLARIESPGGNGFRFKASFLTLTTREIFHPRVLKKFMVRFFKRLKRKFPTMAVVWRLEYQKRGAPHLHCILYNAPYINKLYIRETWGKIIEQEKPFTRIERIRSYKHLVGYASKYCAKVAARGFNSDVKTTGDDTLPLDERDSAGRVWGVYNRACLPLAEMQERYVPLDASWWLIRRYCQTFYPYIPDGAETGFTIFCDDPYHAMVHICNLQKAYENSMICTPS